MKAKTLLIDTYRLIPPGIRHAVARVLPARRLRQRFFESDTRLHDHFYTDAYYETEGFNDGHLARCLCDAMTERFHPTSVLDVGCGPGTYLEVFQERGVEGHGIELASAALARCQAKGLDVIKLDLTTVEEYPWKVDLAYSFEVAEHLAESAAPTFVRGLTRAARHGVVISAAGPGQPGLCHVNCQPRSYWVDLFARQGFDFDEPTTTRWHREHVATHGSHWVHDNVMVFVPRNA